MRNLNKIFIGFIFGLSQSEVIKQEKKIYIERREIMMISS